MNFLSNVIKPPLKKALAVREYTFDHCDLPTRHGFYIRFKAKGLSPGFTWFVGYDGHEEWIEEFLG